MLPMRIAQMTDLPAIKALIEAAYRPWVPILGVEPGPLHDDYGAAIAAGHVSVLTEKGQVLGVLVLIPQDDALLLDNVAVAPDAQSKGHSRTLIAWAEARAMETGYDIIRLYTHIKMASNITLYERHGYKRVREVTERGLPRVYMEKRLGLYDGARKP